MNVQEYISSGIVESCVLGLASADEQLEFERMCATSPEVNAAREAFELSLEKQAKEQAIAPPAILKNKIFNEIGIADTDGKKTAPVSTVIKAPVVKMGWLRYVAAAAILLLMGSTALNLYFYKQYQKYSSQYDALVASQTQMAYDNKALQTKLQGYESAMGHIKDPGMAVIKMPAVAKSPDPASMATVYWDTKSKDVYLMVNNLPQPVSDKQYQLWAIVDGKPVDAGVLDMQEGMTFAKMKNIPKAQAFAITLEKHGGSDIPTMSAMYVLGKV
ncbi:MAG: anti-sigma factor [Bacteroidetes bacterium]|nr:anti-sigma factor [Bacteroidota bacterium]MBS1933984.1 anti-sigma factor [Bacteroidota bacterium]